MYTYYAIAVLRVINIPKWISMMITSLQIIQMIAGVYVNVKAYQYKQTDNSCDVNYSNIYASFLMYASYFYLFFKFFYDKYFVETKAKKHQVNGKKRE
jgi:elongation of very long chain fatty acids protein 6